MASRFIHQYFFYLFIFVPKRKLSGNCHLRKNILGFFLGFIKGQYNVGHHIYVSMIFLLKLTNFVFHIFGLQTELVYNEFL